MVSRIQMGIQELKLCEQNMQINSLYITAGSVEHT